MPIFDDAHRTNGAVTDLHQRRKDDRNWVNRLIDKHGVSTFLVVCLIGLLTWVIKADRTAADSQNKALIETFKEQTVVLREIAASVRDNQESLNAIREDLKDHAHK